MLEMLATPLAFLGLALLTGQFAYRAWFRPEELRELVLRIISTPPVNQFLKLSHFQESPTKRVPFTYVEPYQFAS